VDEGRASATRITQRATWPFGSVVTPRLPGGGGRGRAQSNRGATVNSAAAGPAASSPRIRGPAAAAEAAHFDCHWCAGQGGGASRRVSSWTEITDASEEFLRALTLSLPSAGTINRTAWGAMTRRIKTAGVIPRA
jgi:hypothetical protein